MISALPKNDRVLVEPDVAPDKTDAGLFIPDPEKDKPCRGKVVAVGGKMEHDTYVGEEVLYNKFGGTEVTIDGKVFLVMRETDLLLGFRNNKKSKK